MTEPGFPEGTDTQVSEKRDGFLEQQHLLSQISSMLDEYFATRHFLKMRDPEMDREVPEKE